MNRFLLYLLLLLIAVCPQGLGSADLPRIFKPGMVSTALHEHSAFIVSPKGNLALWVVSHHGHKIILQSRAINGQWQAPQVAAFSGQYRDEYPFFSADGSCLYFMSWRPHKAGEAPRANFSHWLVERNADGWGSPRLNTQWSDQIWMYSMNQAGDVYGWTRAAENRKDADLVVQAFVRGSYQAALPLGAGINTEAVEYTPYIDPQNRYLIFGRMGTKDKDGLYISFFGEGKWMKAERLPEEINVGKAERFPWVNPDGRVLYFNRQISAPLRFSSDQRIASLEEINKQYLGTPNQGCIFFCSLDPLLRRSRKN